MSAAFTSLDFGASGLSDGAGDTLAMTAGCGAAAGDVYAAGVGFNLVAARTDGRGATDGAPATGTRHDSAVGSIDPSSHSKPASGR